MVILMIDYLFVESKVIQDVNALKNLAVHYMLSVSTTQHSIAKVINQD